MTYMRRDALLALAVALGLGLNGITQLAAAGACKEIGGVPNKGCVTKRDLGKKAVTSGSVKNGSLTGKDIRDGSIGPADLAPGAVARPTYVFLSSESHDGGFGVAAWDAVCQSDAVAAGLSPGTYRAWLSTSSFDARDLLPPGPFVDPFGQFIALSKGDVLNGTILRGISVFASGGAAVTSAWTGTDPDGVVSTHSCNDWTVNDLSDLARTGLTDRTSSSWTSGLLSFCNGSFPVYCFQVE